MSNEKENDMNNAVSAVPSPEDETQDVGGIAGKRLVAFIQRIERLEEEKTAIMEDIKEIYGELSATGFDKKAVKAIVRLRKIEVEKRREADEILELYKTAIGMS